MILGPPGTGKTSRLLGVAREFQPVGSGPVLFVSHTRAAAAELADRCDIADSECATIHSLCYGLAKFNPAQIINDRKLAEFGQLTGYDFTRTGVYDNPNEILQLVNLARCTGRDHHEVYANSVRPCAFSDFEYFYDSYNEWKHHTGYRDFNDMLIHVVMKKPKVNYSAVFVDEAQDLSPLQWKVVEVITAGAELAVVVGDDDQAIFEWGGAWPAGIADFIGKYDADVEVLSKSWRVPRSVHAVAMRIVDEISNRIHKPYDPRDADGEVDRCGDFGALSKDELKGTVVLYRDASMRGIIADKLIATGLSYTVRGKLQSPYDNKYGRAWRSLQSHLNGEELQERAMSNMMQCFTDRAVNMIGFGGLASLKGSMPSDLLDVPPWMGRYFDEINLAGEPEVEVGTIHSYKGSEADRVVLCASMGERTATEFAINPDAEHRVFYVGATRAKHSLMIVGGDNEYPI